MTKSFEEYLQDQHARENPRVSDERLAIVFETWLETLGYEETMEYWRSYSNKYVICPMCTDFMESNLSKLWICSNCTFTGLFVSKD